MSSGNSSPGPSFGTSRSGSNKSKLNVSAVNSSDFLAVASAFSGHEGLVTVEVGVFGPTLTVEIGVLAFVVVVFAVEMTACGVCGLDTIGIGVGT